MVKFSARPAPAKSVRQEKKRIGNIMVMERIDRKAREGKKSEAQRINQKNDKERSNTSASNITNRELAMQFLIKNLDEKPCRYCQRQGFCAGITALNMKRKRAD